ncbi:MAG: hypothetical protein WA417_18120, partial [Stellaceae bacterium]
MAKKLEVDHHRPRGVPPLSAYAYQSSVSLLRAYTAVTPALQAAAAANDYVPWHAYGYPASATVIGASTPGGACTVLGSKVSGSDGFAAYGYCVMGAGQQNITLTYSGPVQYIDIVGDDIGQTGGFDGSAQNTGNSTNPNSGNATTTASSDFVWAGARDSVGVFTTGSGWQAEAHSPSGQGLSEIEVPASASVRTGTFTDSTPNHWYAAVEAFKPAVTKSAAPPESGQVAQGIGNCPMPTPARIVLVPLNETAAGLQTIANAQSPGTALVMPSGLMISVNDFKLPQGVSLMSSTGRYDPTAGLKFTGSVNKPFIEMQGGSGGYRSFIAGLVLDPNYGSASNWPNGIHFTGGMQGNENEIIDDYVKPSNSVTFNADGARGIILEANQIGDGSNETNETLSFGAPNNGFVGYDLTIFANVFD